MAKRCSNVPQLYCFRVHMYSAQRLKGDSTWTAWPPVFLVPLVLAGQLMVESNAVTMHLLSSLQVPNMLGIRFQQ